MNLAVNQLIRISSTFNLQMRWQSPSTLASMILLTVILANSVLAQSVEAHMLSHADIDAVNSNPSSTKDRADRLFQQGFEHSLTNQLIEAIQSWQIALELYRKIGDRIAEGRTLGLLGIVYHELGQYQRAIELFEKSLTIARELDDHASEGSILENLGIVYHELGQYQRAIELFEQSVIIAREIDIPSEEGGVLWKLGVTYRDLGQYQHAIELLEQSVIIAREMNNRASEGGLLDDLGIVYRNLSQYQRAIELHKESLMIAREIGDRAAEMRSLNNLGVVYDNLGQYQRAIELFNQTLIITREIENRANEGSILGNLGSVYFALAEYQRAIELHKKSLMIAREIEDQAGEMSSLSNLGIVYDNLGQYQRAIELSEQALIIARQIKDRAGEGSILGNLGNTYLELGQYQRAIKLYEQSLAITQEIEDRAGEGRALGNLGNTYHSLGEYQRAIDFYEQRLVIAREIKDRNGEGNALGNLGNAYFGLGHHEHAINFYEQDLVIAHQIDDQAGKGRTLSNLGAFFEIQQQPELAISFYKRAVNIRKQITQLLSDPISRQSHIETSSETYRRLENLLLEQGRQIEAQQVLELFKQQELSNYTNEQEISIELPDLALFPEEEAVINTYISLVIANQLLRSCYTDNCPNISQLQVSKDRASQQYQSATEQLAVFIQNDSYREHPLLRDNFFLIEARKLVAQQPGTVLIYPIILKDKFWLLWVTEEGVNSQQISNVNQQTLTQTINAFRNGLEDRYSELTKLQTHANQLYNWLIAPVEAALDNTIAPRNLILALDRNTRYIPIAALYDGQQYLIEKYDISTILAASLTNIEERAPTGTNNISILAAGVSEKFQNFPALPNVPIELDAIVKEQSTNDQVGIYSGQQLLNPDFTVQNLKKSITDNTQFLHIATHGEFVPGNRYSSYLLMGNGEKLPLPEITNLGSVLNSIHLAVLSACQTALGGADEEGLEIAGLGYYFFKNEVDAVMASLWNVNDASTSELMQSFYKTLSEGTDASPITKAEALRTAQLSLLQSNNPGTNEPGRFRLMPINPNDQPLPEIGWAHPYYWAPFILIGNSL